MKWKFLALFMMISFQALGFDPRLIQIRSEVEKTAIQYFIDNAHPETGLVSDKAPNFQKKNVREVSSLAATGFGLSVIAHAAIHGKITKKFAEDYTIKTLKFIRDYVPHHKGWLLHFVNWETGERVWKSEYSTIDTALLLAGALYAAKVLKNAEISELTHYIYDRVDYSSALTDEGRKPNKKTLSLSYTPENGWTSYQWETYAEQAILIVLGIGHPSRPLPVETWRAWRRDLMGIHMPLFIHQYSPVFIDFRNFPEKIWDAGMAATFLSRNTGTKGYWGWSAGESPDGYLVSTPISHKATVCIGCAAGSAMFAPEIVMKDIYDWKNGQYGNKLWGRYGLTDSIDLERNWFSPYVLGITKGPEYLSVQNMEGRTSIWKDFMEIPAIKSALAKIKR